MNVEEAYNILEEHKKELAKQIKEGNHKQFVLDGVVKCRCGKHANWWKTGYVCSTITSYNCKYSK